VVHRRRPLEFHASGRRRRHLADAGEGPSPSPPSPSPRASSRARAPELKCNNVASRRKRTNGTSGRQKRSRAARSPSVRGHAERAHPPLRRPSHASRRGAPREPARVCARASLPEVQSEVCQVLRARRTLVGLTAPVRRVGARAWPVRTMKFYELKRRKHSGKEAHHAGKKTVSMGNKENVLLRSLTPAVGGASVLSYGAAAAAQAAAAASSSASSSGRNSSADVSPTSSDAGKPRRRAHFLSRPLERRTLITAGADRGNGAAVAAGSGVAEVGKVVAHVFEFWLLFLSLSVRQVRLHRVIASTAAVFFITSGA